MSLRVKMVVAIGAILLLVILVYALVAVQGQVQHLRNLARREAELIAAIAARATVRAMTDGKSDEVQALLEKISEGEADLVAIRIINDQGLILRSGQPEEIGKTLAAVALAAVPKTLWDYEAQSVAVFRPIHNGPACYACHSNEQPVLGFLNAAVSFPNITSEVTRNVGSIVLPALLALLTAGVLIALYFAFAIGRRIDDLSEAMSRVQSGDLESKAPEENRDELGQLGKSFNAMVSRLAKAKRQIEDRHAEEVRRAENLASLGKMAAGVAHEINNPLAGMQNCVRTLAKKAGDDAQRKQYLTMLQEGLERIGRTVRQLLDFAREARPKIEETDLVVLVRRSLALLEHELVARKISFSLTMDSGLPPVLGDSQQLEQVFLNTLMNAVEAMPDGGAITISVGLSERRAGRFAEARVRDTGTGIPAHHLPQIFDPFFTTKEVGKGTGLGLSVSYGIVKAHGGSIDVESEIGKGSTFTVVLPVTAGSGNDAAAPYPS
ncbi:MAG: HAMP domain-containing protein [Deltaproteobacteria bacterium]|nr:HAMP domain-containing protein [Deltaproteobacteria bacterium]